MSDRITILRNGMLVGNYETNKLPKVELIARMIGKDYEALESAARSSNKTCGGENFLTADNLGCSGSIKPFSLKINKQEVLGLAGLLGSGRTETARVIFGADKPDSGRLVISKKEFHFKNPIDAIKMGIAYCPEDRKRDGILSELSIKENIVLTLQAKKGLFKFIDQKSQRELAEKYIKLL